VIESPRGRRNNIEIYAGIIETTVKPTLITRIVYDNLLNFNIVNKYLEDLIEVGLIRYIQESRKYEATEKGKKFF
jgi:predicted transcriptional regulator